MKKNIIIICSIILSIFIIAIIIISNNDKNNNEYIVKHVNDLGYIYDKDGLIYKKVVSNNNLDEYYTDIALNNDTNYLEYYFTFESYSFIQLHMTYSKGVSTVFNAVSDLNNNKFDYTYEITKNDSSAIIEGIYDEGATVPFTCDVVVLKKLEDVGVKSYCDNAFKLLESALNEKKNLLNNKKFKELIDIPKPEVVVED